MKTSKGFRFLAGPALVVAMALPFAGGCSAKDAAAAAQGCGGLDVKAQADLTVSAFADAADSLKAAALKVEAQWATVCNAINKDLNLDTTKTDAAGACGVLNARIKTALAAGVTVSVSATYECKADVKLEASCQGECAAKAGCDIEASCSPGELSGTCSGSC
jgi:hypothetical protein